MEMSARFPSDGIPDFIVLAGMKGAFPRIDELSRQLKQLGLLSESNQKRLDKKFRMEFNYNSNHIEGNTLTYNETELLLIFDDTQGNHTLREYEEMKAHDVALKLVKEWAEESKDRPLTEQNIKNLNEIILVRPFWKDALTPDGQKTRREIKVGDYKAFPNSVILANGEVFEYASPQDTPIMMGELMAWYRNELEKQELEPVALAAIFHYKFVHIHPFDDGNGRLARLLMNYVLFCFGLPPVVIKSSDKTNYLRALNRADARDLKAFVAYIALQLEWSLELAIKAAKGESIEEEDDLDKEIALLGKEVLAEKKLEAEGTAEVKFKTISNEIVTFFDSLIGGLQSTIQMFVKTEFQFKVWTDMGLMTKDPFSDYSYIESNYESFIWRLNSINEEFLYANLTKIEIDFSLLALLNSKVEKSIMIRFNIQLDRFMFSLKSSTFEHIFFEAGYLDTDNKSKIEKVALALKKEIQKRVLALAKSDSPTDPATA